VLGSFHNISKAYHICKDARTRKGVRRGSTDFKFLFFTHGLGACVVKNVLARFSSIDLSFVTVGVIFLEPPNTGPGSEGYSAYLQGLIKESALDAPDLQDSMSELRKRLEDIDENWQTLGLSAEPSDYVQPYNVWSFDYKIDINSGVKFTFQQLLMVTNL